MTEMSILRSAQSSGWMPLPSGACRSCLAAVCQPSAPAAPGQETLQNPAGSRRSSTEKTFVPTLLFTASVGEVL